MHFGEIMDFGEEPASTPCKNPQKRHPVAKTIGPKTVDLRAAGAAPAVASSSRGPATAAQQNIRQNPVAQGRALHMYDQAEKAHEVGGAPRAIAVDQPTWVPGHTGS